MSQIKHIIVPIRVILAFLISSLGNISIVAKAANENDNYFRSSPSKRNLQSLDNGKEYKWFVRLGGDEKHIGHKPFTCGGVLVSSKVVLSSARCSYLVNVGDAVYIGATCGIGKYCEEDFEVQYVKKIYKSSNFVNKIPYQDDYLVIQLQEPTSIVPVALDDGGSISLDYEQGTELLSIGNDEKKANSDLQQKTVSYINREQCSKIVPMVPESSIICVKRLDVTNNCFFEIGGPLYDPIKEVVVGIATWDTTDCSNDVGPIYSRLSYNWSNLQFVICNLSHYARPKFCPGYVSQTPTLSPKGPSFPRPESCRDDRVYVALYLLTDRYGSSDTRYQFLDSLGNEIDRSQTLASSTEHIVEKCLPCGIYTFTLFDDFGDGIIYPGGFSLHVDGEMIESSWRKSNEGMDKIGKVLSTTFTGTAEKCSFAPSLPPTIKPTSSPKPTVITRYPTSIPSHSPSRETSNEPSSSPTRLSCPGNQMFFELTITTDMYPEDTTITIVNTNRNEVVFETKDFKRKTLHTFKMCLPCSLYELRIRDSYGDGIQNGGYDLKQNGADVVIDGLVSGKGITKSFGIDDCSTKEPTASPTPLLSNSPSALPSIRTNAPTFQPTVTSTGLPSNSPELNTSAPTFQPNVTSTDLPSNSPIKVPNTKAPTINPTVTSTVLPTIHQTSICALSEMFIELNLRTDQSPDDISLVLIDSREGGVIFHFGQFNPDTIHVFDRCVPCNEYGYRLLILTSSGNGISEPGGFNLSVDGHVIVSSGTVSSFGSGVSIGNSSNCKRSMYPIMSPSHSPVEKQIETFQPSPIQPVKSLFPSAVLSAAPTAVFTASPTVSPTYAETSSFMPTFISVSTIGFHQSFGYNESLLKLDDNNTPKFIKETLEYYAAIMIDFYADLHSEVESTCNILEILQYPNPLKWILVKFDMTFTSSRADTTPYGKRFEEYLNDNLERLSLDLAIVGVTEAFQTYERQEVILTR